MCFISLKADAEDFLRLRYLLPYSSEVEIDRNSSQSKVKLETAGNSCNFIFVNGIGLGYNSLSMSGKNDDVFYKFKKTWIFPHIL